VFKLCFINLSINKHDDDDDDDAGNSRSDLNKFTSDFWHICITPDSFFNVNTHDVDVTLQTDHLHFRHTCSATVTQS